MTGPVAQGPIVQDPIVQGWCPGALRPMMSGDGLVVRVRLHGGRLPKAVALRLAELSRAFGNGLIDLSARGNMQIRGVTEAGHAGLIAGLSALGLIDADARLEAMRNIQVSPFWYAGDGHQDIAGELAARLATFPDLPGKFGYAVDIDAATTLREAAADVRIERGETGLIVRADGTGTGAAVTAETAVDAVLDLVRWFVDAGGVVNGRGRMAALVRRGVTLPTRFLAVPMLRAPGFVARPGPVAQGVLVGFEFGQMRAETLAALAAVADMRVTSWRMLLIESASVPDLAGVITRADDPALRVVACTGAPACLQAHAAVRDLGRVLAPHVPQGALLHLSGCAKGCAHPAAAALTLTATPQGFDLIRKGTAADAALARLTADDLLARPALLTETFNAP